MGLGITVEFLGSRAFADSESALAKRKLVVIVARGGLDGLSLSPPVGDPNYAALRGSIALAPFGEAGGALKLDGDFGLHPVLSATHRLAMKGEARIAPAVATPDRERSHFEAQDVLESGASTVYGSTSGWLNRALEAMGPAGKVKAMSVGAAAPLILRGRIEAASWAPGGGSQSDPRLPAILQDLYAGDPLLGPALAAGLATQAMAGIANRSAAAEIARAPGTGGQANGAGASAPNKPPPRQETAQARRLGATLAGFMTQPGGAQVAAVVIDGFDTHAGQGAATGRLATRLAYVDAFVDGLSTGLGGAWSDTVVVMATEFGRTARVNGTAGTDHGTASTALLLGGALKKGGIVGDWPTLAQAHLFENRDTAPTLDMRGLFKGVLRDHLGVDRARLDTLVFPGSAAAAPVAGLVA
ncbi:MAG: DUF1501 domain-containing protein [Caulobacteraceae bacterium]